ncbi:MAG: MBL fold metallo-hydrolase [Bacteroidetes bacterium]|nr:MBL fold metallo-hydrolase [Bacteroidota bacterium]
MNTLDLVEVGRLFLEKYDKPTSLFLSGQHAIYWLGMPEDTAFRCNTYLIVDGREAIIVDPGGVQAYDFIKMRIEQILPLASVTALIVCHQDPDVAASMVQWLDFNPAIKVITSIRTNILLPHYGKVDYTFVNINESYEYYFSSGNKLKFIEAPFLHFPGAFVTFDEISNYLFSGDIWASVDMDWKLVVDDFNKHELKLSLFHIDYMASNIACKGFLQRLGQIEPDAILPQHGSVIPKKFVPKAFDYLRKLKCGLDLIYSGLK